MFDRAKMMEKMVVWSRGNRHDVNHFMKVHAFAALIGALEGMEGEALDTLEAAAIVHDIACPLCREKYGNTHGIHQEQESEALLRPFLADQGLSEAMLERVVFLVTHHHTYAGVEGLDWRVLLEADFLVNCDESGYSAAQYRAFKARVFRTPAGIRLLESLYPEHEAAIGKEGDA